LPTPSSDPVGVRAAYLIDALVDLHCACLYRTDFSYLHVERLAFALALREARARRVVPFSGEAPPSDVRSAEEPPKLPVVAWDHIIGPDEAEDIVQKLSAFPQIAAYRAGHSYRGRDV